MHHTTAATAAPIGETLDVQLERKFLDRKLEWMEMVTWAREERSRALARGLVVGAMVESWTETQGHVVELRSRYQTETAAEANDLARELAGMVRAYMELHLRVVVQAGIEHDRPRRSIANDLPEVMHDLLSRAKSQKWIPCLRHLCACYPEAVVEHFESVWSRDIVEQVDDFVHHELDVETWLAPTESEAVNSGEDDILVSVEQRLSLLAEYKDRTSASDHAIYHCAGSTDPRTHSCHKPQFLAWKSGALAAESLPARSLVRFLRTMRPPPPQIRS